MIINPDIILVIGSIVSVLSLAYISYQAVVFALKSRREMQIESKAVKLLMRRIGTASLLMGITFGLMVDFTGEVATFPIGVLICTPIVLIGVVSITGWQIALLHSYIADKN